MKCGKKSVPGKQEKSINKVPELGNSFKCSRTWEKDGVDRRCGRG